MQKDAKQEMSPSELTMRKFLKQLGVTGHQELSLLLEQAVVSGTLKPGADVAVVAKIEVADLKFSHVVSGSLKAPYSDD